MSKYISIIIPNYNGMEYLKECLDSIQEQTFNDYEIILVDDLSSDKSVEYVKNNYKTIKIIQMERNSGFSKVVNEGIKQAVGEYIFLLNNDTRLGKNCLEEIRNGARRHPEYAMFACKVLSMSNPNLVDSAGDGYSVFGNPYKIGYKKKDGPVYQLEKEVFGACAAAAVYKRALFRDIGLFDEDFGFYNEDSDLNFRARLKGYRCLYVPSAVVYHKLMGSYGKRLGKAIYQICRNKINLIVKDMPTALIIKYLPFLILGRIRDLLMAASKFKFLSGLMGIFGALWQLPLMLKKRREIQSLRKISDRQLEKYLDWTI